MSLEAIKEIIEAEELARLAKTEALALSKKLIAEEEENGKLAVTSAAEKADEELRELKRETDEKAAIEAKELSRKTENSIAAIRVKAESRMDAAVALVTERIVNG